MGNLGGWGNLIGCTGFHRCLWFAVIVNIAFS